MGIREKGYTGWEGQLKSSVFQWIPISLHGIQNVFKKRYAKLLFALTSVPFFIFLLAIYASTKPELQILTNLVSLMSSEAKLFHAFFVNGFLMFMLVILSIFCGADLLANDLKFKAFPLYFARPLSKLDYLLGKLAIIISYLLFFSLVPALVLLLAKMLFTGNFAVELPLAAALFLFPVVFAFFLGSLTLMVSSLSYNTKFIQVSIFMIYLLLDVLANTLRANFHSDYFCLLSFAQNAKQMSTYLFRLEAAFQYPAWLSLVFFVGLSLVFLGILYQKIRKAEASI